MLTSELYLAQPPIAPVLSPEAEFPFRSVRSLQYYLDCAEDFLARRNVLSREAWQEFKRSSGFQSFIDNCLKILSHWSKLPKFIQEGIKALPFPIYLPLSAAINLLKVGEDSFPALFSGLEQIFQVQGYISPQDISTTAKMYHPKSKRHLFLQEEMTEDDWQLVARKFKRFKKNPDELTALRSRAQELAGGGAVLTDHAVEALSESGCDASLVLPKPKKQFTQRDLDSAVAFFMEENENLKRRIQELEDKATARSFATIPAIGQGESPEPVVELVEAAIPNPVFPLSEEESPEPFVGLSETPISESFIGLAEAANSSSVLPLSEEESPEPFVGLAEAANSSSVFPITQEESPEPPVGLAGAAGPGLIVEAAQGEISGSVFPAHQEAIAALAEGPEAEETPASQGDKETGAIAPGSEGPTAFNDISIEGLKGRRVLYDMNGTQRAGTFSGQNGTGFTGHVKTDGRTYCLKFDRIQVEHPDGSGQYLPLADLVGGGADAPKKSKPSSFRDLLGKS